MGELLMLVRNFRCMQYIACLTAALTAACSYMIGSWSSPAVAQLTSDNSPIGTTLTHDQASWVASIALLGFILGCLTTPLILIQFGPKWSLLLASIPLIVSWLAIAFGKSLVLLLIMRFILGIGDGIIITVLPLYLGEVADKDIRGKLTTAYPFMASMGNLFVYSVGPFVSYTTLALCCSALPVIFAVVFIFLPDSPYFLVKHGKLQEGKHNVRRLLQTGITENVINERLEEIQLTVAATVKTNFSFVQLFSKKNFRVAFFINLSLKLLVQLSGITAIRSYLQTIIGATNSSTSPEVSSIIFGVIQIPSVLIAAFLMDKLGRRQLLIVSTAGCATALIGEGVYFYLQDTPHLNLSSVSWLPTLSLVVYLIMLPVGISSVNVVMMSELFADNIKCFVAPIVTTIGGTISFLFTRYFLLISDAWGMYTTFWICATVCIFGLLFAIFILPETKGKSFLEIQEILKTKSYC